jgi:hypothetical protein
MLPLVKVTLSFSVAVAFFSYPMTWIGNSKSLILVVLESVLGDQILLLLKRMILLEELVPLQLIDTERELQIEFLYIPYIFQDELRIHYKRKCVRMAEPQDIDQYD